MTTEHTFGEQGWEVEPSNGGGSKEFFRFEDGSNEIRLLTKPYKYIIHKVKKNPEDPKDFGTKVMCSKYHGSCPLCDLGEKVQERWFLGVISRHSNSYRILDIGQLVYKQIKSLADNQKRWGDPTKYDIDIVFNKNGGATGMYLVQPIAKDPLSAEDIKIRDSMKIEDLIKRVTPPSPETVRERMNKIRDFSATATKPAAGKKPTKPAVSTDGDDEFPNS